MEKLADISLFLYFITNFVYIGDTLKYRIIIILVKGLRRLEKRKGRWLSLPGIITVNLH